MNRSKMFILWMTLIFVFLLFLAGCNEESSSGNESTNESPSAEKAADESSPGSDSAVGNPAGKTTGESTDKTADEGDASNEKPDDQASSDEEPSGGDPSDDLLAEKGSLTLYLADATTNYQAVYVTISEVQVHTPEDGQNGGGWATVGEPEQTYNLLELVNGVMAELGTTELETGHYTMLRMILGEEPDDALNVIEYAHPYPNYIVDGSGEEIELFVPSGYQTGIKLVSGFDIIAEASTELVLDFDASRSVVKAGRSGKYLLKPTIKVVDMINRADLSGAVTDEDNNGIAGAIVSAQIYHEGSENAEPTVEVFTSTRTDADGRYMLYLPQGDYNIVAYKELPADEGGMVSYYGPECRTLKAEYDFNYSENFTLHMNDTGTLAATVEVIPEQTVSISAWKSVVCNGETVHIEVPAPLDVTMDSQTETHQMVLPVGRPINDAENETIEDSENDTENDTTDVPGSSNYTILVETEEEGIRKNDVVITSGEETALYFNFTGAEDTGTEE